MFRLLIIIALNLSFALAAQAQERLKLVADIAPVASLVEMVAGDLAEISIIIPAKTSPHDFALRPQQAKSLQSADLIVWMGHSLTPQLERPLEVLGQTAKVIELLEIPETKTLPTRTDNQFDAQDDDHAGKDDHGHHHGADDPHAWLSPENAVRWLAVFADQLSTMDPTNAEQYALNAARWQAKLKVLTIETSFKFKKAKNKPYLVFHDAYQYFENRFGVEPVASVALSDAVSPGPKTIRSLQSLMKEAKVQCAFAEPQFDPKLMKLVVGDNPVSYGTLDALGQNLEPSADLYPQLLTQFSNEMLSCLK